MAMVIKRNGGDGSLISPAVILDMSVSKCDDPTAMVGTVGEVKKGIPGHVNSKIGPADAVGINILEGEDA